MPTEQINIFIFVQGAGAAAQSIQRVGRTATTTGTAVNRLKSALVGLGIGLGLRELKETVDTYIQIENRVNLVTTSTQEFNSVLEQLYQVSQDTRASFEATSELYRRLAINTKDLGFTQERLIGLIKTINQSIVISGATAKEARSGLIQLSQGFASGQLRGEEFRSVAEQLPGLLIAIADGMGMTIGQLREFAFAGKLSAVAVAEAIESQQKLIDELFKDITPTIEQAGIQLGNAFTKFIGKLNKATSGSTEFRDAIGFLRDNIEEVSTALFSAAAAYTAYKVAAYAAAVATNIFKAGIRSLLISTGIGAIVVALTLAIDALITFGLSTEEIQGVTVTGFNKIGAAVKAAWETFKWFLRFVQQMGVDLSGFWREFIGGTKDKISQLPGIFKFTFKQVTSAVLKPLNDIIGAAVGTVDSIKIAWDELPAAFKVTAKRALNAFNGILVEGVNALVGRLNDILASVGIDRKIPLIQIDKFAVDEGAEGLSDVFAKIQKVQEDAMGKEYIQGVLADTIDSFEYLAKAAGNVFGKAYQDNLQKSIDQLKKAKAAQEEYERRLEEVRRESEKAKVQLEEDAKARKKREAAARQLLTLERQTEVALAKQDGTLQGQLVKLRQQAEKALELGRIAKVRLLDNKAFLNTLRLIYDVERKIAEAEQKQGELTQTLADKINQVAFYSAEAAQELRDARDAIFEAGGGTEVVNRKLEDLGKKADAALKKFQKEAEQTAKRIGDALAGELTSAFERALKGEGFDIMEFFSKQAAKIFEKSMAAVFTDLAKVFQEKMQAIFKKIGADAKGKLGGVDLGAGLGALVGVGGLLLTAALQKGSQQVENELAAESIVTDVRDVRGVVAGPTNIPIFQLGAELEDALNPTNEILMDIRDALQGRATATSVLSVEEEAGMLLNSTSPTLI